MLVQKTDGRTPADPPLDPSVLEVDYPDQIARDALQRAQVFSAYLNAMKIGDPENTKWYPYGSMNNFGILSQMLGQPIEEFLHTAVGQGPIIDIGCADGDTAYYLESLGYAVDAVDYSPTNFNGMKGIRVLKERLKSTVNIIECNLDGPEGVLKGSYRVALALGLLYHLRNPMLFLDQLRRIAEFVFVSTRIVSHAPDNSRLSGIPVAYLVGPSESNNDSTNYWFFSLAGLLQIVDRCGFDVLHSFRLGAVGRSLPHLAEADERIFLLLKRRG